MAAFELIARNGEEIEIVPEIPVAYSSSRLAGSEGIMARGSFGNMLFWHHQGEGFDIWKSMYDIKRDVTVTGVIHQPVLELSTMYENSFHIDWKDVIKGKLDTGKIEMYYSPGAQNDARFKGGMRFGTVDIHFQKEMLVPYAREFPLLDVFLGKVYSNSAASLFNTAEFMSPAMESVIRGMVGYSFIDTLAPRYFDGFVNVLLVLLLERISGFQPADRKFSPTDIANAIEARRILDMERVNTKDEPYTVGRLCKRLYTNPYKLQTAFRHCFHVSIGAYRRRVFMEHARELLLTTTKTIDEVALSLGYGTAQNFITAFNAYFKETPGQMRRKRR